MKSFVPFFLLLSFLCEGQIATFQKTYGYGFVENAYDLQQTTDGGFVLAGTQGITIGHSRIFMIKTDSLGNEEWHRFYGYPYDNSANSVRQTLDGGYIIIGYTSGDTVLATIPDIYIIRTNTLGDTLWTRTYGGDNRSDAGADVMVMNDNTFVILANTRSFSSNNTFDTYLFKINDQGQILWEQIIGEPEIHDGAVTFEKTSDGGFIMAGVKEMPNNLNDGLVFKTDSLGNLLWRKTYGSAFEDVLSQVCITPSGEIYVAGTTAVNNPITDYDLYLLKLNNEGDSLWTTIDNGTGIHGEIIKGLIYSSPDDKLIVVQNNYNDNDIYGRIQFQKIDLSGNIIWTKRIEGGDNLVYRMIATDDGGIAISGLESTDCFSCAYLVKTDGEGNLITSIGPDISKPVSAAIINVYPNPTEGIINITLRLSHALSTSWMISDIYGRTWPIAYTTEMITDYMQNIVIDLSRLQKGVYFLQLYDTEGVVCVEKIIVL